MVDNALSNALHGRLDLLVEGLAVVVIDVLGGIYWVGNFGDDVTAQVFVVSLQQRAVCRCGHRAAGRRDDIRHFGFSVLDAVEALNFKVHLG